MDAAPFLRTIIDRPHDDTPRLVYADWLDDTGDPVHVARAEFIRVQCRIAAADRFAPDLRPLRTRERELFTRFGRAWLKLDKLEWWVDAEILDTPMFSGRYRRGFIDTIRFRTPAAFLDAAESLFERTPLTGVILTSTFSDRAAAFRLGSTPTAESLPFPAASDFRALLDYSWFTRLRFLGIDADFCPTHLAALLETHNTRSLRDLSLAGWNCHVVGPAWEPIARSDTLRELRSLDLRGCELHEPGLRALVRATLPNLERLFLGGGNRWSPDPGWMQVLTTATNLPTLTTLIFRGARGGAEGLRALARWPTLKTLRHLDLTHNYTDDDTERDYARALGEFAASPNWGDLRELNLDGDSVPSVRALVKLMKSPNLRTLRRLTLDMCAEEMEAARAQNRVAKAVTESALSPDCEFHFYCEHELSEKATRLFTEKFGDRLTLYPDDRQIREYRDLD